jgi:hypothetical protein
VEGAKNSVKGVHFGTHRSRCVHASHEALTLAHPAREVRVFKAALVGEREDDLGADLGVDVANNFQVGGTPVQRFTPN